MAGQPSQSGDSPLDQPRDQGPRDREATPEAPPEKKPGEEGEQEKPSGKPEGEDPNSPRDANPPGDNQEGDEREEETGDEIPASDDNDKWGMLPMRTQEIFRNQGRDDLPVQYREWIDAYYRELNRNRAGGR